jgi:hypothetical protein
MLLILNNHVDNVLLMSSCDTVIEVCCMLSSKWPQISSLEINVRIQGKVIDAIIFYLVDQS